MLDNNNTGEHIGTYTVRTGVTSSKPRGKAPRGYAYNIYGALVPMRTRRFKNRGSN